MKRLIFTARLLQLAAEQMAGQIPQEMVDKK